MHSTGPAWCEKKLCSGWWILEFKRHSISQVPRAITSKLALFIALKVADVFH